MKARKLVLILLVAASMITPAGLTLTSAQTASAAQEQAVTEKININTATAEMLTNVPGIGPKTAAKIVSYRKENGTFQGLDDLLEVKGIGDKSLKKMMPYLTM